MNVHAHPHLKEMRKKKKKDKPDYLTYKISLSSLEQATAEIDIMQRIAFRTPFSSKDYNRYKSFQVAVTKT